MGLFGLPVHKVHAVKSCLDIPEGMRLELIDWSVNSNLVVRCLASLDCTCVHVTHLWHAVAFSASCTAISVRAIFREISSFTVEIRILERDQCLVACLVPVVQTKRDAPSVVNADNVRCLNLHRSLQCANTSLGAFISR